MARNDKLPGTPRKPDIRKNGEMSTKHVNMGKIDEKFPLRINASTVIYVTEDKCNEEYRQKYLKRMEQAFRNS